MRAHSTSLTTCYLFHKTIKLTRKKKNTQRRKLYLFYLFKLRFDTTDIYVIIGMWITCLSTQPVWWPVTSFSHITSKEERSRWLKIIINFYCFYLFKLKSDASEIHIINQNMNSKAEFPSTILTDCFFFDRSE